MSPVKSPIKSRPSFGTKGVKGVKGSGGGVGGKSGGGGVSGRGLHSFHFLAQRKRFLWDMGCT
jgi:hypothetical protein